VLKELVIADNRFVDLSPIQSSLPNWATLTRLDASGNRLCALPANMSPLKDLETLDLSFNLFDILPAGVCFCPALKKVNMRKNFLMKIPAEIGMLTSLEDLDISENNLQHVSPEIRNLTNICTLNLSKNELEYLPPLIGMTDSVFGNLGTMQMLDISNNRLVFLPLDMRKCSRLTDLHVYGNPLKHPAMLRAQTPCFGSLNVTLKHVSSIVYLNQLNQPARTAGNPICTVR
jgi:leucine-rich repeat protein SHOC2